MAEHKNLHMTHVDELPILQGPEAAEVSLEAVQSVFNKITSDAEIAFNVKWDGAPAVYAGWDPSTGGFIMALKSLFAKSPKIIREDEDIDTHYGDKPDLADKMHAMWEVLSASPELIPHSEIWQGDFLFTEDDLTFMKIDGKPHLSFHPNTILYVVDASTELGKDIASSKVGIVWHTRYRGSTLENMSASFDIYEKDIKSIPGLWSTSVHGQGNLEYQLPPEIITEFEALEARAISTASLFSGVEQAYELLMDHRKGAIPVQINAMVNQYVKDGALTELPVERGDEVFLSYLEQKYEKRKEGKDEKSQAALDRELGRILDIFNHEKGDQMREGIVHALRLQRILHQMKMIIMKVLNDVASKGGAIRTYLLKREGSEQVLKPANPEGFVVTTPSGFPLKFVDREQFSRANFSPDYVKGWEH